MVGKSAQPETASKSIERLNQWRAPLVQHQLATAAAPASLSETIEQQGDEQTKEQKTRTDARVAKPDRNAAPAKG